MRVFYKMGNYQIQFSLTEILFCVLCIRFQYIIYRISQEPDGSLELHTSFDRKSSKLDIITHSRTLITKEQRTLSKSRTLALGVLRQSAQARRTSCKGP